MGVSDVELKIEAPRSEGDSRDCDRQRKRPHSTILAEMEIESKSKLKTQMEIQVRSQIKRGGEGWERNAKPHTYTRIRKKPFSSSHTPFPFSSLFSAQQKGCGPDTWRPALPSGPQTLPATIQSQFIPALRMQQTQEEPINPPLPLLCSTLLGFLLCLAALVLTQVPLLFFLHISFYAFCIETNIKC